MYIKQVVIKGIGSYRNETVVNFSERCTAIGSNGTGKSNIFVAIGLIFDTKSWSLPKQERRYLLSMTDPKHRGNLGFVKVVLNNESRRFPLDSDKVVIRRVIHENADQFFINDKLTKNAEVRHMLEAAGFCSRNPYYLVAQGRVNEISSYCPEQLLELLNDIAGVTIYKERFKEIKEKMASLDQMTAKGEECMSSFEATVSEMRLASAEVKQFQAKKKEMLAVNYVLCERNKKNSIKKLEKATRVCDIDGNAVKGKVVAVNRLTLELEELKKKLNKKENECKSELSELELLDEEKKSLQIDEARLCLTIDDIKKSQQFNGFNFANEEQLTKELNAKTEELQELDNGINSLKAQERRLAGEVQNLTDLRRFCCIKQNILIGFGTSEERNEWISEEIKKNTDLRTRTVDHFIVESRESREIKEGKLQNVEEELKKLQEEQKELVQVLKLHKEQLHELELKEFELLNESRENVREADKIKHECSTAKSELNKLGNLLFTPPIYLTYQLVLKVVADDLNEEMQSKFLGIVINKFECIPELDTAVEAVAGLKLFRFVAETDEFVTRFMNRWNHRKLKGQVHFIALNRVTPTKKTVPDETGLVGAFALLSKLEFDGSMRNVLSQIFGGTLVCANIDICVEYAKTYRMDCVTCDGDVVSSSGAFSGGYYGNRNSKIENFRKYKVLEVKLERMKTKLQVVEERQKDCHRRILEVQTQIPKEKRKIDKAVLAFQEIKARNIALTEEQGSLKESFEFLNDTLANLNVRINDAYLDLLRAELSRELQSSLSREEQMELDDLGERLNNKKKNYSVVRKELTDLEKRKLKLQHIEIPDLHRKIGKRKDSDKDDVTNQLNKFEHRLQLVQQRSAEIDTSVNALFASVLANSRIENELKEKLRELQELIAEQTNEWENSKKAYDQSLSRKIRCEKKVKDATEKFLLAVCLPEGSLNRYRNVPADELFAIKRRLKTGMDRLQQQNLLIVSSFDKVNSDLNSLTEERNTLTAEREAIDELLRKQNEERVPAIITTFKQVFDNFTEIFCTLVPGAVAEMYLIHEETLSPLEEVLLMLDKCTGITMKVSFSGNRDQMQSLRNLSGGQKSVVSLSLIFAIQSCDPAPFYLFDEIDQHLDGRHTEAVADYIREHIMCQVIMSTFKPAMLNIADEFRCLSCANGVSHIDRVSKEEAVDVLNRRHQ